MQEITIGVRCQETQTWTQLPAKFDGAGHLSPLPREVVLDAVRSYVFNTKYSGWRDGGTFIAGPSTEADGLSINARALRKRRGIDVLRAGIYTFTADDLKPEDPDLVAAKAAVAEALRAADAAAEAVRQAQERVARLKPE